MSDERLDILDLAQAYADTIDRRDTEAFVSLFEPDGDLRIFEHGELVPTAQYRGRDQLAGVMGLVTIYPSTFHLVANHRCAIAGDRATGVTYTSARHLVERSTGLIDLEMLIRYEDQYRRRDGAWRFQRRDVFRQWTTEHAAERAPLPT